MPLRWMCLRTHLEVRGHKKVLQEQGLRRCMPDRGSSGTGIRSSAAISARITTTRSRTIGQVHARIGLEPRWYIGGYARCSTTSCALRWRSPSRRRAGSAARRIQLWGVNWPTRSAASARTVLLDIELAISVYFEESERAAARRRKSRGDPRRGDPPLAAGDRRGLRRGLRPACQERSHLSGEGGGAAIFER